MDKKPAIKADAEDLRGLANLARDRDGFVVRRQTSRVVHITRTELDQRGVFCVVRIGDDGETKLYFDVSHAGRVTFDEVARMCGVRDYILSMLGVDDE